MSVHVIKATKPQSSPTNSPAKLRVAAYARVSTSSDAQETSYESQCIYYTKYISTNPSWTFAGIYADEGISGTTTKNREQFNKMIEYYSSFRERKHQHDGRERGIPHHDHVVASAAGIRLHLRERPHGYTIPDAAGKGKTEYYLVSRIYKGR